MTFRSQIEPSIKSYECFMILRHIQLFEYTLSQFCSRFTLLLELEWPSSWDSKTGVLCKKNLLPPSGFGPSCDEYLSQYPLPLAPCPSLSHLNTFRAGSHGTPCQTKRSRDSLPRRACPEC